MLGFLTSPLPSLRSCATIPTTSAQAPPNFIPVFPSSVKAASPSSDSSLTAGNSETWVTRWVHVCNDAHRINARAAGFMLSKMMTNDFPARWPLTLCLILKRTSPGHASGFCAASRFWRPCQPSAARRRTTVEFFERGIITTVNSPPVATALCSSPPAHCPFPARDGTREGGRVGEGMATVK